MGVAYAWAGEFQNFAMFNCLHNFNLHSGNWPLAEKCLADAAAVLVTRMVSHPTEKEELESIVSDIKGRIAEHKEMEKGVFSDSYVKAPGGLKTKFSCKHLVFQVARSCPTWVLQEQLNLESQ